MPPAACIAAIKATIQNLMGVLAEALSAIASSLASFGTYALEKEKGLYLDGLIGGGYGGYTMQRNINFGTISRTATGNPGAGTLNAMLATGYDLKKGNWIYGPTTTSLINLNGVKISFDRTCGIDEGQFFSIGERLIDGRNF